MDEVTRESDATEAARTLGSLVHARRQLARRVVAPVSFHHKFGFVAAMGALAQPFWVTDVKAVVSVVGLLVWGWALRSYYVSAGRTLLVQRRGSASVWPILLAVLVPMAGTVAAAQTQSMLVAALAALAILFTYAVVLPCGDAAWARGLERDVTLARTQDLAQGRAESLAEGLAEGLAERPGDSTSGRITALFHGPYRSQICTVLAAVHQAEVALLRITLGVEDRALTTQIEALEESGHVTVKRGVFGWSRRPQVALTKRGRRAYRNHLAALGDLANPGQ